MAGILSSYEGQLILVAGHFLTETEFFLLAEPFLIGYFTMNDRKVFPYFSGYEVSSDLKPEAKLD